MLEQVRERRGELYGYVNMEASFVCGRIRTSESLKPFQLYREVYRLVNQKLIEIGRDGVVVENADVCLIAQGERTMVGSIIERELTLDMESFVGYPDKEGIIVRIINVNHPD